MSLQARGAIAFLVGGTIGLIFSGFITFILGLILDLLLFDWSPYGSAPPLSFFSVVGWGLTGTVGGLRWRRRTLSVGIIRAPETLYLLDVLWKKQEERMWTQVRREQRAALPINGALSATPEADPEGQLSTAEATGLTLTERDPAA